MKESYFKYKGFRNSYTEMNEVYFWTITVNNWQQLLQSDDNKMIVINSLRWLVQKELVKYMGMLLCQIMFLMWEQLSMNGKEFPKNSFEKFTAKSLVNKMKLNNDATLQHYSVSASDRQYNIWLRDPLAIKFLVKKWQCKS